MPPGEWEEGESKCYQQGDVKVNVRNFYPKLQATVDSVSDDSNRIRKSESEKIDVPEWPNYLTLGYCKVKIQHQLANALAY